MTLCERFRKEFGYRYVDPWPIYDRVGGRRLMYFMIHATNHPAAPELMRRSYNRAIEVLETTDQIDLFVKSLIPTEHSD